MVYEMRLYRNMMVQTEVMFHTGRGGGGGVNHNMVYEMRLYRNMMVQTEVRFP